MAAIDAPDNSPDDSFVVISGHWGSHRAIFRYVNRINDKVIGINMVWLLMVVLTPFAARTLAASTDGFGVRFAIYALVQAVALTCLVRLGRELAQGHLLREDAPASARRPDNAARYAAIASFLISIPVAFATPWAYAIWGLGPAVAARYLRARNRPASI
jgi:TMEM175 potassium channel family protein